MMANKRTRKFIILMTVLFTKKSLGKKPRCWTFKNHERKMHCCGGLDAKGRRARQRADGNVLSYSQAMVSHARHW